MTMKNRQYEFWPGPLEGVCRREFIRAADSLQLVEKWMTPFLRVSEAAVPLKNIREFLAPYSESGVPVYAQIMGVDPLKLAETARRLLDCQVAGINLNCGCPSRRVVNGGAGGGMLKTPDLLRKACAEIKAAIAPKEFSLKCRAGFADFHEVEHFLPPLIADGTIDKFFFHCRTVAEQYAPVPDSAKRFELAAQLRGKVPLILNGDLDDSAHSMALLLKCDAQGAMFARNWMRDPYLLRRLAGLPAPDAETGRERFFATLLAENPARGERLEVARMLWGANSEKFRLLLDFADKQ